MHVLERDDRRHRWLVLAPLLVNTLLVCLHVPLDASLFSQPILNDDLSFVYGAAVQGRDLFLRYGLPWGYDPGVGGGGVVTPAWYPNALVPTALLTLFAFVPAAAVFNAAVLAVLALWPLLLGRLLRYSAATPAVKAVVGLIAVYLVWGGLLLVYLVAGMLLFFVALLLISLAVFRVGALATGGPQPPALTGRSALTLGVGVVAASALHLAFGVAWLGLVAASLTLLRRRFAPATRRTLAWTAGAVALLNAGLLAAAALEPHGVVGATNSARVKLVIPGDPGFFLFFAPDVALFALGLLALETDGRRHPFSWVFAATALLFVLSFPLNGLPPIFDYDKSYAGVDNWRQASFFLVGVLPFVADWLQRRAGRRPFVLAGLGALAVVGAVGRLPGMPVSGQRLYPLFRNQPTAELRGIVADLGASPSEGRVLIEDSGHEGPHVFVGHLAEWLGRLTDREIVLHADDLPRNDYQALTLTDGRFCGQPLAGYDPAALRARLELFDVTDVYAFSDQSRRALVGLAPDFVEGASFGRFVHFRARAPSNRFLKGQGRLHASRTELELTDLKPDGGSVVLKYQFSNALRPTTPGVALREFPVGTGGAGFVEIVDPPPRLTLAFDGLKDVAGLLAGR